MKRWVIILILCSIAVTAQTISDYPQLFFYGRTFTGIIIKGDVRDNYERNAVNYELNALPEKYFIIMPLQYNNDYYTLRTTAQEITSKVRIASQVENITSNAIVIGTPCNNVWVQKLLDIKDCKNFIKRDEGLLKLVNYNGYNVLVVTGGTGRMVYEATLYLNSLSRPMYTRELSVKRGTYTYAYPIGGGTQILPIGVPIGQVTPAMQQYPYNPQRYPYNQNYYPTLYSQAGYKVYGSQYGAMIYVKNYGHGQRMPSVTIAYPT